MLSVTTDLDRATLHLTLRGELAMDTVEAFLAATREAAASTVHEAIFDCNGLTFIDSTGVSALLQAGLRLRQAGIGIRVENLDEEIKDMLEVMGFFEILESQNSFIQTSS